MDKEHIRLFCLRCGYQRTLHCCTKCGSCEAQYKVWQSDLVRAFKKEVSGA